VRLARYGRRGRLATSWSKGLGGQAWGLELRPSEARPLPQAHHGQLASAGVHRWAPRLLALGSAVTSAHFTESVATCARSRLPGRSESCLERCLPSKEETAETRPRPHVPH
jgi:hypothetical protein